MIKLIINRFADEEQEIKVNVTSKMTTSGYTDGAKKVSNFEKALSKLVSDGTKSLEAFSNKINNTPSLIGKMQKAFEKTDFTKIVNFGRAIRRTTTSIVGMVESAATYEESLNLYTMALGKYAKSAAVWEERISEKLLLDPSQVMQYTGAFYNLTKGLKVTSDDAYLMSKNLTQLTYDMASYLNISNEAAYTKIQSAMAGQSRAVQSVGVATQVASLQELAYELGIKKKIATMTQAEKTYLRYIQLMRSTQQMQGDLGRTMITPANAMRTLKTQVSLLGRSIGQVLTPFVMQAIPYIMALTNVLTQMASALAKTFGYNIAQIDYSDLSFEDATDGVANLNKLGNAAAGAGKKAKNSLAPFDELNQVISSSKSSGSGGIGDDLISKGVFDKILPQYDMLKNYNDKFVKQAKDLEGTVKTIIGFLTAGAAIASIIKLYQWVYKILTVGSAIQTGLIAIGAKLKTFVISVIPTGLIPHFETLLTLIQRISNALLIIEGVKLTKEGTDDLIEGFKNGSSAAEDFANTLKLTVGGALTGIVAGASGPVGAVAALTYAYVRAKLAEKETYDAIRPLQEAHYGQILKTTNAVKQWNIAQAEGLSKIYERRDADLASTKIYDSYLSKLYEIVDANGKIKKGYEGEASVIVNELNSALGTNIEIRNGEIKNIDKVRESVEKLIEKKRAEIKMEAYRDAYKNALMDEKNAYEQVITASNNKKLAQQKLDEYMNQSGGKNKTVIKSLQKAIEEADTEYRNSYDHYREIMQNKTAYEQAYLEFTKGNYKEANDLLDASADHSVEKTTETLVKMTETLNGDIGQDLTQEWAILALTNVSEYNNALSKISDDDTRKKIINNVSQLIAPMGATGTAIGNIFSTNFVDSSNNYMNNNPVNPNIGDGDINSWITDIENKTRAIFGNKKIELNFTPGNSASDLRKTFVMYFNKNPIQLRAGFGASGSVLGSMDLKAYATGGFPDSGDLFFANENGNAEFIASIGQKTAVANQDQMVSALTNAILAGMQNIKIGGGQRGDTIVYIGNDKVYQGQGQYQSRQNDRYGTSVVRI